MIATGGKNAGEIFPAREERSSHAPARLLLAGLFHGVSQPEPTGLHLDIVPGAGEIFQSPVISPIGCVSGLTFEALPGGPWEQIVCSNYASDYAACAQSIFSLLRESSSEIVDRIDINTFSLTRPLDLLQGAVTPTVRKSWIQVGSAYAVAIGDAAVVNDPITGQGANLAVDTAWALSEMILADYGFDEQFCRDWDEQLWQLSRPSTAWSSAALNPMAQHVEELLQLAASDQALADAFIDCYDDPARMWRAIATPTRTKNFVALHSNPPGHPARDSSDCGIPSVAEFDFLEAQRRGDHDGLAKLLHPAIILVDETGLRTGNEARHALQRATASTGPVSEVHTYRAAEDTVIITYCLNNADAVALVDRYTYCTSVWSQTESGWRLMCRQESTREVISDGVS
ncbi:styrene monooxygenase/indole monooxygenase family protein [Streptomyces collinus]|uniref:styrene monooxygenase/indole monooxygenase family protein n=1 Tax=Streptomyces collinus TaxID=42684 RepID=UPI0036AD0BBB